MIGGRLSGGSPLQIVPDPRGLRSLLVEAPEYDARFEIWGNSPVQAIGTVLGRELYFRARHDGWSFEVADHAGNLPSDGFRDSDGFYREDNFDDASWMPHQKAVVIIERCLRGYTGDLPHR